jgi:hypothetical protein
VLGAWKFQQEKFCNYDKSGLGFLAFSVLFQPRKAYDFSLPTKATCVRRGGEAFVQEERERPHV